jgi:hypothetical protein
MPAYLLMCRKTDIRTSVNVETDRCQKVILYMLRAVVLLMSFVITNTNYCTIILYSSTCFGLQWPPSSGSCFTQTFNILYAANVC